MSITSKRNQKGFTLVELIVVMTVVSILSITVTNFIVDWTKSSTLAEARSSLLTSAETSMDTITNDIMLSGSVEQNNRWPDANGPSGNQYGWTSNSSTLVLAKVATNSTDTIIFSDPAEYITQKDDIIYFLSGTTLYRRTLASTSTGDEAVTTCPSSDATSTCPADMVVATGVSSFTLAYYDDNGAATDTSSARSVQVGLTLSSKIDSQTINASYSTRMVFRNE